MNNDLIKKAKHGDQRAFTKLYNLYYKDIHSTILYNVKDEVIAKDILSTTFVKAFGSISTFTENISFKMWLKTIAVNNCIDYFRKETRRKELLLIDNDISFVKDTLSDGENIETQLDNQQTNEDIQKVLDNLNYKHRNLLKKRYYDGLSYEQLAEYHHVDIGTIKSNLNRAHRALRECYKQILNKKN